MRAPLDHTPDTNQNGRPAHGALEESLGRLWRQPPEDWREDQAKPSDQQSLIFAAIVATVIGAMALIGLREKIVRISPRAAAPYAAVGLPVNLDGLAFAGVRSRVEMEGTRRALVVEGEIVNLRRDANLLPPLALSVRGADGQDKYAWTRARRRRGSRAARGSPSAPVSLLRPRTAPRCSCVSREMKMASRERKAKSARNKLAARRKASPGGLQNKPCTNQRAWTLSCPSKPSRKSQKRRPSLSTTWK